MPEVSDLTKQLVTIRQESERAIEALQASEGRWRSIFENSPVGIALADASGRFTAANRAYQAMLGYTQEELLGLTYHDITHEADRETNRVLASELFEGKRRQFTHEKRYQRKDGKTIWVRNTVSLAPGQETKDRFAWAIVEDITERKQAEEQLRRSEAYLGESQRMSHVGSWAFTISPRQIVFWSPEHYRIFGFDADMGPVFLESAMDRIHAEDRIEVERVNEQAIRDKSDFTVDYRIVLPGGTMKYCHTIGHPVINEGGEVVEFTGTVMDVTRSKLSEEALHRSFDQLRALADRLQTVREEERKRVAREIHDELGQALTAIKIDLKSLIFELPPQQKSSERAESIVRMVDQTIQSVRKIATELRPGILDDLGLVAAVEWAALEFQARTGIRCNMDRLEHTVEIDQELAIATFRIFQETLTNVARHSKATAVDIQLAVLNGSLRLEVRDNGSGASEEDLLAGLGILGMRERALLLRGEFSVSGSPGLGTTVRVTIPSRAPPDPSETL